MNTLRLVANRDHERFEIVESPGEGFYALRYVDGQNTHDYLQDDAAMALQCAKDEWGLRPDAWRSALPDELPLLTQEHPHPIAPIDLGDSLTN